MYAEFVNDVINGCCSVGNIEPNYWDNIKPKMVNWFEPIHASKNQFPKIRVYKKLTRKFNLAKFTMRGRFVREANIAMELSVMQNISRDNRQKINKFYKREADAIMTLIH